MKARARLPALAPGAGTPAEGAPSSAAVPRPPPFSFSFRSQEGPGPRQNCQEASHAAILTVRAEPSSSCSLPAGSPAGASSFSSSELYTFPSLLPGSGGQRGGVGMGSGWGRQEKAEPGWRRHMEPGPGVDSMPAGGGWTDMEDKTRRAHRQGRVGRGLGRQRDERRY